MYCKWCTLAPTTAAIYPNNNSPDAYDVCGSDSLGIVGAVLTHPEHDLTLHCMSRCSNFTLLYHLQLLCCSTAVLQPDCMPIGMLQTVSADHIAFYQRLNQRQQQHQQQRQQ